MVNQNGFVNIDKLSYIIDMSEASSTPGMVKPSSVEGKQRSLPSQMRQIRENNKRLLSQGTGLDQAYSVYDKSIFEYQNDFNKILQEESIVYFVNEKPSPVVIDFMGPSNAIAILFSRLSLFSPDKTKFGLAISLEDRRSKGQVERDEKLNIQQLAGNIMEASTWRRVKDALQGRTADLIMERAAGGLKHIPVHEKFYAIAINKAWQMLSNQNGMLLVEIPEEHILQDYNIRIREWIEYLKEKGIDSTYVSANDFHDYNNTGSIKLIRKPDSPKDLPFLKIPGMVKSDQKPAG